MFENKEYVLAVINEGSFSKAAKQMYISQPSLSASIRRIEEKISVPLFDRSTAPVSLTEAGREYVKYALEIEEIERAFSQYVSDHYHMLTGTVRIGGSSFFSSFILPRMISRFHGLYPHIDVEIFESNTELLLEKLHIGALDIVLDNAIINDEQIKETVYTSERLLLAVPEDFEINKRLEKYSLTAKDIKDGKHLLDRYAVSLELFSNEPFILLNSGNDTGNRAEMLFKKHKVTPQIKFYLDQQLTAYNISGSGMGIAFVSDTLITHSDATPPLLYYRLDDAETERNICFYVKKNHYLSQVCQRFIEVNTEP